MMKHYIRLLVALGVLLLLVLALTPAAAQEEASIRIGYFAFDPTEYDTYIDGEIASFNAGWEQGMWARPLPDIPWARCCSATPFMDFASGVHSFAFVPKGEGLDTAVLVSQDITFDPGHVYSLALVGDMNMDNLTLLTFDEMEVHKDVDREANFMGITVHSITDGPPIDIVMGEEMIADSLEYGEFAVASWPDPFLYFKTSTSGEQPVTLFELDPSFTVPRLSDLTVVTGSFPGEPGEDLFWDYNWYWSGEINVVDGGEVAVDSQTAGEVASVKERVAYTLTLDTDTVVNMSVKATGERTEGSLYEGILGMFDPSMYVYDGEGNLLFWNDEETFEDDSLEIMDPALKEVPLQAGVYSIQVGGYADLVAGPYELIVEKASGM